MAHECRAVHCKTSIEALNVPLCGDCQMRIRDARQLLDYYVRAGDIPRERAYLDYAFADHFPAGCLPKDLAFHLGIDPVLVQFHLGQDQDSLIRISQIQNTGLTQYERHLMPWRISPKETIRVIAELRSGRMTAESLTIAAILQIYPDLANHPDKIDFLKAHLNGCAPQELNDVYHDAGYSMICRHLQHAKIRSELREVYPGGAKYRVIPVFEVAWMITTEIAYISVGRASKATGLRDLTLLADARAGRVGPVLVLPNGDIALRRDIVPELHKLYPQNRKANQKLRGRGSHKASEGETKITAIAELFGLKTRRNLLRFIWSGDLKAEMRHGQYFVKIEDLHSFLRRLVNGEIKGGKVINATSAESILKAKTSMFKKYEPTAV